MMRSGRQDVLVPSAANKQEDIMKTADTKTAQATTAFDQLSDEALAGVNGGFDIADLFKSIREKDDTPSLLKEPMQASFFHLKWPIHK